MKTRSKYAGRRMTPGDVLTAFQIPVYHRAGNEVYIACPVCGAVDRGGKPKLCCGMSLDTGAFNCLSCETSGSMWTLAKLNLGNDCDGNYGALKDKVLSIVDGDSSFTPDISAPRGVCIDVTSREIIDEAEKRSPEECSKVYFAMLSELTLRKEDRADLNRRGLSDADISRFKFKSVPITKADKRKVCQHLVERGYDLEGVPGFHLDDEGEWTLNCGMRGYFCPVYQGNLVVAFQIRTGGDPKYIWLASKDKEKGCSSGAPCAFLPGENTDVCLLVEGTLKALVTYCLLKGKVTCVSVPGMNCISALKDAIPAETSPYIIECYDMEKADTVFTKALEERARRSGVIVTSHSKDASYSELAKHYRTEQLAKKVREEIHTRFGLDSHSLTWDIKQGLWNGNLKGIDDFLLSYEDKEGFIKYLLSLAESDKKMKAVVG